jgi:hypothetical protein
MAFLLELAQEFAELGVDAPFDAAPRVGRLWCRRGLQVPAPVLVRLDRKNVS